MPVLRNIIKVLWFLLIPLIFLSGCSQEKLRREMEENMEKKKLALAHKSKIAARKGYLIACQELKKRGKQGYFLCYLASGPDIDRKKGISAYWEYRFEPKGEKKGFTEKSKGLFGSPEKRFEVIVEGGKVISAKEMEAKPKGRGQPAVDNWLDSPEVMKIVETYYAKESKNRPKNDRAFWMQMVGNGEKSYWEVYYGKTFFGKDMKPIRINALTGKRIEITQQKKKETERR